MTEPCPECGELTEVRIVDLGYAIRIPGLRVRLGPHHDRRCPHYRKEVIPE